MSRTGVIVAVLLAILLCGIGFLLLRTPGRAVPQTGPILDFDPALVSVLTIQRPGKPLETLTRTASGAWTITLGPSDPAWPASAERVRAGLRILSTLTPQRQAEPGAKLDDTASTLTLKLDDNSTRTLGVAARPLAGAALVENPDTRRAAWVDASVSDMISSTGLAPWRDERVLGDLGPDVARLTIRGSDNSTIQLARVQGRWALRTPVTEPADQDALGRLLTQLASVRVVDFLDHGAPETTGLADPVASLIIESDLRSAGSAEAVTTATRTLDVGQIADVGGRNVFAKVGASDGLGASTARTVVVTGEPLANIDTRPESYVAKKAVQTPASEIGQVRITRPHAPALSFKRTLDGWRSVPLGGQQGAPETPLTQPDEQALAALLALLTHAPADSIAVGSGGTLAARLEVQLLTLGGEPLDRVSIAQPGGQGSGWVVSRGPVARIYKSTAAPNLDHWSASN